MYVFLTDGNEISDFGESLRFQEVLQGQEVSRICTPYVRVENPSGTSHHPSPMRCFPSLGYSRSRADTDNFLEGNALCDASQFRKVLQGQEARSILPYARVSEANNFQMNNANLLFNGGAQLPIHDNSWSNLHHIYSRPPPVTSINHNKPEIMNRDSLCVSQRNPLLSQQLFVDNQKFAATCKKSCRLFGFALTEGKISASSGDAPTPSSFDSNLLPCNEDQMYQPPLILR